MAADDSNQKLEKLKIESYTDPDYKKKGDDEFVAMFNPEKYSLKYEIDQDKKKAAGTSPPAPTFAGMKAQEIDLEFVLDGTGAAGVDDNTGDVLEKVDAFLKVAYLFDGKIHKPLYLRLWWGKAFVFDCVLQSADVSYTLFKPSGTPLRARISAKFLGFVNDKLRAKKEDRQSPDITHIIRVPAKERIDYLCFKTYDDEKYYLDVAANNGLNNFRKLKPASQVIFPPLV